MEITKIRGPVVRNETCPEKLNIIVEVLFPEHQAMIWPSTPYGDADEERVSIINGQLIAAAKKMKEKKVLSPDEIPNVALKTVIETKSYMFWITLQFYLDYGYFLSQ